MKKNIQKKIYILLSIAILLFIAYFVFLNNPRILLITNPLKVEAYDVSANIVFICIAVLSYIAGVLNGLLFKSKTDELCQAYEKRHENISIQKDSNDAKIATLEAKIATLEAALEKALNK